MSVPTDQMTDMLAMQPQGGQEMVPAGPPAPMYVVSEERVKKLWAEFREAREFDEMARKDYAFCRAYARGDSDWEVSVNLLGTYVDIMVAFLYARNPDVSCVPAPSVGNEARPAAKLFGETVQTVISRAWRDTDMRRTCESWVRSVMTTGIGWIKSGWQEEYSTDPAIEQRKRDIQENLARIEQLNEEIASGEGDIEARREELLAQQRGLEGHVEQLVYRGLFNDFLPSECVQVSLDVRNLIDCDGARWIAHINYMPIEEAKAKFKGLTDEDWKAAETFHINKPTDVRERSKSAEVRDIQASEADPFQSGAAPTKDTSCSNKFIMHVEMWRADENLVYDLIKGVKKCAGCAPPNVGTTRFYPFFPLAMHEVDGERHPQSLVMRTYKLMDEYNRTRTGKAQLRRRIKPKMFFDARAHTPQQIKKITDGTYGELIPLKPAVDGASLQQSVWEQPYPRIDPALFDLSEVRQELETMWGIQEALAGGIRTAKTATEAEIQQAGTNARTGAMREREESVLTKLALYHAEILVQKLTLDDAKEIAGAKAVWPKISVDDLDLMLQIEIAAGTTGRPNTTAQREAWSAEMPVIQGMAMQIGGLLKSSPQEIARVLEEMVKETMVRSGDDNVEIERFIPQAGQPMLLMDPQTGMPVMAYPADAAMQPGMQQGTLGDGAPAPAAGGDTAMPQGDTVAPVDLPPILQS